MEQLIRPDVRILINKILEKIQIELTGSQLASLVYLLKVYFHNGNFNTMSERVNFMHMWDLYEKKLRTRELSLNKRHKIKLNIAQAQALHEVLCQLDTRALPYETSLIDHITDSIFQQTV